MAKVVLRVIIRSLALGLIGAPYAYSRRNERLSWPEIIVAIVVAGFVAFWIAFIVSWESALG